MKYGRPVAVTVKVTSTQGTPTGKVRVLEGSRNLGTTTLSGGAASFRLRGLAVGTHTLTVVYDGNATHATSQATVTVKVMRTTSRTKVSTPSVTVGTAPRATVTVISNVTVTGKATVTVRKGTTVVAKVTGTLRSGVVTVTLPKLARGTYAVSATYGGSTTITGSTGGTTLVVNPR